jgi:hypothetical protein
LDELYNFRPRGNQHVAPLLRRLPVIPDDRNKWVSSDGFDLNDFLANLASILRSCKAAVASGIFKAIG